MYTAIIILLVLIGINFLITLIFDTEKTIAFIIETGVLLGLLWWAGVFN